MSVPSAARPKKHSAQPPSASNFIRAAIEADLASGKYASRGWGGNPGPAKTHEGAAPDPAGADALMPTPASTALTQAAADLREASEKLLLAYGASLCLVPGPDTKAQPDDGALVTRTLLTVMVTIAHVAGLVEGIAHNAALDE